jgi:3-keto-5-aminohexanoate cleavage enzyme
LSAIAVIAVAPNGARRGKADHPGLPITPEEIAREAARCTEAGASLLHLHVRDDQGRHSLDAGRYREAIAAVRRSVGDALVIQITTEAADRYGPEEQMEAVRRLKPEAASVAVAELILTPAHEAAAAQFYHWAAQEGVALQHILYDPREVAALLDFARRGVIPERGLQPLFVLGKRAPDQPADPRELIAFLELWPPEKPWSVCAFGRTETAALAMALALGGHVRVGFENSLVRPDGSMAADNAEAVGRIVGIARALGRRPAKAQECRALFAQP